MGVRNDFLGLFEKAADARVVPAGETIFQEGDPGDRMYVILEGEVCVRVGGHEVSRVGPGSIFGEMALIDHSPRSASAVAKTACRLVGVDEARFMQLVRQMPQFALEVMKLIANRLRVTDAALGRPKD